MLDFGNKEDLAECAGFFNGEGCTSINRAKKSRRGTTVVYKSPRMAIAQTKDGLNMLNRFRDLVGGIGSVCLVSQKTTMPYKDRNLNIKPRWVWQAVGYEAVQTVLGALWSHLSPVKREQAKNVLAECVEEYRNRPDRKPLRRTKTLTLHPIGVN